jgi:hypothetical protein
MKTKDRLSAALTEAGMFLKINKLAQQSRNVIEKTGS